MARLTIPTASGPLDYRIAHRARVKRRLHLELDEDGGLVVVVPSSWSMKQVDHILNQNTVRVERFLARARERLLPPLVWAKDGMHWFRGARYRLDIRTSGLRRSRISIAGDRLLIVTSRTDRAAIRFALQAWYRQQAMIIGSERLQAMAQQAPWTRGRNLDLKLRRMKRTWGTCSRQGVIRLNTHLVKAPPEALDYVIAHELCHIEEMNHGPAFYELQKTLYPGWQEQRRHLRDLGHRYTQE
jgi:predicted metal-dependent hydrolase